MDGGVFSTSRRGFLDNGCSARGFSLIL